MPNLYQVTYDFDAKGPECSFCREMKTIKDATIYLITILTQF